jgi:hypothetical protein
VVASDRARRAPAPSPEGKWPTDELHKIEPFHYLVSLLRHSAKVALDPAAGMPWNYTAALAQPVLTYR